MSTLQQQSALGIEFGSTRIKAVLIDSNHTPIASGSYQWENQLVDGVWTYAMPAIREGLQACYADLKRDYRQKTGTTLTAVGAIGISGMMHGYLPLDARGEPLTAFRTWRNTMTGEAAAALTELFQFNIPQRWCIAHLYQAILRREAHVPSIHHITTIAGYVHELLTGQSVLGVGEASGVFPVDSQTGSYDAHMLALTDDLFVPYAFPWKLREVLPPVLCAGAEAGRLTPEGALLLDPEGDLRSGIPFAPPEGDAGTGMTATNSVALYTGNVSAGTSDFAMVVVDKLPGVHREIDMVTTPDGKPVAMVHCNNCTSDINAWARLFGEFAEAAGLKMTPDTLYTLLFNKALEGAKDGGGLMSFNYLSGEGVTDLDEGRPVFLRTPDAALTLADFMRTHLYSALATLKIGLDLLVKEEHVRIDRLYGHGGFFKTPGVGQRILSAAVNAPVSVMETAGEGGPYGMALLAAYMLHRQPEENLSDYLNNRVFAGAHTETLMADPEDVEGFNRFLARYIQCLPTEKAAIATLPIA